MAKPTTDRRIQRTRKLLQDALVSMMIEKGYEATTVQDIIDRANVGRATFYAHFADKQTLLASSLEDLRAHLIQAPAAALVTPGAPDAQVSASSLAMLEHAVVICLCGASSWAESGAVVLQRLHRTIADLAGIDLVALGFKGTPEQRVLAAEYVAGAFISVLTWWLNRGAELPAVEVDIIFRRLVMRGLAGELGLRPDAG
jgi:AcrR family transcriptional regulator